MPRARARGERQVPLRLPALRIPHGRFPFIACAPSPCGPSLAVSRLGGRYPADYFGHSVAIGLASRRRSHVHTGVRVERDLGGPSVSFNTLTGYRSCAPEHCGELVANSPQGPVPVSGVVPVGAILHLLETRLQAVWLSPCRADPPARHPIRLGMDCRFPGMLLSPTTLSGPGQPSDPETSPPVSARCAGDTPVHLMAHRLLRTLRDHRTRAP